MPETNQPKTTEPDAAPSPEASTPPPAPGPIRWCVLIVSAVVGLTTIAGMGYALLGFPRPVFATFGFELVATVAAAIGVLLGLGRFREGFGLAALCVAGTFLTGAVFGLYLDANANITEAEASRVLRLLILLRVGSAAVIAGLGGLAVLLRAGRSWGYLVTGLLVASPALAVVAWLYKTKGAALSSELGDTASTLRSIGVVAGGFLLMVLFSVGAHLCIRAFEVTRPDDRPTGSNG